MKTVEDLANEKYYDIPYPKNIASVDDYTTNEIRLLQRIAYVAGYTEAMRWRDPKEELPEIGKPVSVKYRTAKNVEKYGIGKYFNLGIGNPWTIEGSTGREVIGWRPIE